MRPPPRPVTAPKMPRVVQLYQPRTVPIWYANDGAAVFVGGGGGAGVKVAVGGIGRRVFVAVGGTGVFVGGTGVNVAVGNGVLVSVAVAVKSGVGVSVAVGVNVGRLVRVGRGVEVGCALASRGSAGAAHASEKSIRQQKPVPIKRADFMRTKCLPIINVPSKAFRAGLYHRLAFISGY